MPAIPEHALAIAEDLDLNLPPYPDQERIVEPRYAVLLGPEPDRVNDVVQRLRLRADEVSAVVSEVRSIFRARGRTRAAWHVGPSSTPADLGERLGALGLVPEEGQPMLTGMVLRRPPPSTETVATVRRVDTLDDFRVGAFIFHRSFHHDKPAPREEKITWDFTTRRDPARFSRHLAFVDGQPVAVADAVLVEDAAVMCGGATLPEARGKGAYRALVAARWEEAAARGKPVLVVQAGAMSRPILGRLGFEEVAEVRVMLDVFG